MPGNPFPLDMIKVASPCPAAWEGMTGTQAIRFCPECRRHVYNLSGMSRVEAEELVRGQEGSLCVRFYRRADGTVLTADCPVGVRAWRRRLALGVGVVVGFLGILLTWVTLLVASGRALGREEPRQAGWWGRLLDWFSPPILSRPPGGMVMGKMCPPNVVPVQPVAPEDPGAVETPGS